MHLRFIARKRAPRSHVGIGVFASAYDPIYDDATPLHIAMARHLAWPSTEAGVGAPVREMRADDPGEIVFRDANQIVAVPKAAMAKALR